MAGFAPGFPVSAKAVGLGHVHHSHSEKKIPGKYKQAITGIHQYDNKRITDQNKRKLKGTDRNAAGLVNIEWSVHVHVSGPNCTLRNSIVSTVPFLYNKRGPPQLS